MDKLKKVKPQPSEKKVKAKITKKKVELTKKIDNLKKEKKVKATSTKKNIDNLKSKSKTKKEKIEKIEKIEKTYKIEKTDKPKKEKDLSISTKSKNLKGGNDVISASIDLINSFKDLGKSIFHEINTLTNIQQDLNNGTGSQKGVPNNLPGPPPFNAPSL